MKKVIYGILACVIISGIIITATIGLNADITYSKNVEIDAYIGKTAEIKDIKQIAKEVFGNEKIIVQKIELFDDMFSITMKDKSDNELNENSTIRKFRIVQKEGNREVARDVVHYNLQMIIALGFKIDNERAIQFRKWANAIVKEYTIKGFAMDDERLKNSGSILTEKYFDELLERIREIRLSERRFYQKVTDIYATSIDYDRNAKTTLEFFKKVQNKMHYAVTGNTAAEIIYNRADSKKEHMGLTNWSDAPNGKIIKSDVLIAKNYLNEEELYSLRRIVSAYLDLAESRAIRHIPMTMEDWSNRLDEFLKLTDREILQDAGKISHKIACDKAKSEFEKYRIIQDQIYFSDFDKYINELEKLDVSDKIG